MLGKSYEHCRKIARGEAVVSQRLNSELCRILKLDADEMWRLASREKAAKRFGWSTLASAEGESDDRLGDILSKLGPEDRLRVLRFAEALLVSGTAERSLPFDQASQ
jgi:hypothetical protein